MRRTIIIAILALPMAGCQYSSAERISLLNDQVRQVREVADALESEVEALEDFLQDSREVLKDPNLSGEVVAQVEAAIDVSTDKLKMLLENKAKADHLLNDWERKLDDLANTGEITWLDELGLYGEGAAQVGTLLPPPVGSYVIIIGSILGLLGGSKFKKVAAEGAADKAALADVIASINAVLSNDPANATGIKDTLKSAQTKATRARIKEIV